MLEKRVSKLEDIRAEEEAAPEENAYAERWRSAYLEIAKTMSIEHLAIVNAALAGFFQDGDGVWEYIEPFLAARVYHLCTRRAQGLHAVLAMPPGLAALWITFERDLSPANASERFAAHHSTVDCADCGAEFPQLRPFRWNPSARAFTGASRDYVSRCLLCGGRVGFHLYNAA